ncbi:MAG: diguanylate cyclase [Myxococcota bacterium]
MAKSAMSQTRFVREGLKRKIVLFVSLSTCVAALVVGGISGHAAYSLLRDRLAETHPLILEGSVGRIRQWLEAGRAEIRQMARSESLQAWSRAGLAGAAPVPGAGDPALTAILTDLHGLTRTFSSLVVVDGEGRLRASVGAGPELDALRRAFAVQDSTQAELLEVMRRAELRSALAGVSGLSLRVLEVASGEVPPAPIASVPLVAGDGLAAGSLHGLFRREGIGGQLRADLLGPSGNLYVADGKGRVIVAARDLAGGPADPLPAEVLAPLDSPELRPFARGDGRPAIGSARPVGALDLTLVVQQTLDEVFQPLVPALVRILAAVVVIFLFFTFLARRTGTAIAGPLAALSDAARRISQGNLDVEIPRPSRDDEVGQLIDAFNQMKERLVKTSRENETIQLALEKQNQSFRKANELLALLSTTDGLTKLHNHRYFQDQLTRELKRIARCDGPLSLLILDIDDFKKLNDEYGHAAGDEVLVHVAQVLKESIRETDLLARYGGEEFVIVAVATELDGAAVLAEKVCTAIAESSVILDHTNRPKRVTVSVGVSQFAGDRVQLFQSADDALYRAKAAGKNCVVSAELPDA